MALFFLMVFRRTWKPIIWLSLTWAVAVSFAQMYVGVHYPFDILAGAALGTLIGLFTSSLFLFFQPDKAKKVNDN